MVDIMPYTSMWCSGHGLVLGPLPGRRQVLPHPSSSVSFFPFSICFLLYTLRKFIFKSPLRTGFLSESPEIVGDWEVLQILCYLLARELFVWLID